MENNILISGFTFIKNGLTLGYPVKESILSILPLCDEVVVNVGFEDKEFTKDDGTYQYLINAFQSEPKVRFLKSYWDPEICKGGLILSQQTNIALDACRGKYCQYIQADEAIHEDDLSLIREGIQELEKDSSIDGLIFKYVHFYGNTNIIKKTRNIYRREVRLIRKKENLKSYLDAQGFRYLDGSKPTAKQISARILHYGWARKENIMSTKVSNFGKLYHGQSHQEGKFNYERIWGLRPFKQTHPKVMTEWIEKNKNDIDIMNLPVKHELKNIGLMISDAFEFLTGYRLGEFKNYKEVK